MTIEQRTKRYTPAVPQHQATVHQAREHLNRILGETVFVARCLRDLAHERKSAHFARLALAAYELAHDVSCVAEDLADALADEFSAMHEDDEVAL